MTSPSSQRAYAAREKRRARTPPDVVALLEKARQDKRALDEAEKLGREVERLWKAYERQRGARKPWSAAHTLGLIADLIVSGRAKIDRAEQVRPSNRTVAERTTLDIVMAQAGA